MARLLSAPGRLFNPRSFPYMTRTSFFWELRSALAFPFAMVCLESGVIGVIAQRTFHAGDLAVAAVTAAPMAANLTSFLWARLLIGKDRVRAVVALQILTSVSVALVGLTPTSRTGLATLIALVYLGRSLLAGLVTARTDIWRSNYPRRLRATIVGRYAAVVSLIISVSAMGIGVALDATDGHGVAAFREIYLGCAAISIVGAWAMSHVRWRGRAAILHRERATQTRSSPRGVGPAGMLDVLRTDTHFRSFMGAQFVLGMSAMAGLAPFIIAVDKTLGLGYSWAIVLTQVAPTALTVLTIPLWARLLNRVHIVRFRVWHAWLFVAANALTGVGLAWQSVPALLVARCVLGAGNGGGRLAWNLGHHDFAPRHLATLYMGIHVTLTGVRGVITAFLGTLLYSGWSFHLGEGRYVYAGMGAWLFALLAAVSLIASLMFARLGRRMNMKTGADHADARTERHIDSSPPGD